MPQTQNSLPKGVMLKSTAFIFIALAFVAGLLAGSLYASHNVQSVAVRAEAPRQAVPAGGAEQAAEQSADTAAHIAQVRDEIARNPEEALNWIHLGNLYFDSHQPEDAIQAYQTALRLKPGNADVMTDLGTMYRMAGDPQKALEIYEQVINLDPSHQNARINKGVTLTIDLGKPAEGMAAWKALLARKPDAVLSDGTPLNQAIAGLATDAGNRLEQQGKTAAALEAYDQALAENPEFEPALAHKAALLEKMGRKDEAAPLWKRQLSVNPDARAPDGTPVKNMVKP